MAASENVRVPTILVVDDTPDNIVLLHGKQREWQAPSNSR
jgi:hypothetical protein